MFNTSELLANCSRSRSPNSNDRTPLLGAAQSSNINNSGGTVETRSSNSSIPTVTATMTKEKINLSGNLVPPEGSVNFVSPKALLEQHEAAEGGGEDANNITGRLARVTEHYRIDTNVQIGLEMMSPFGSKAVFYSWYTVLIVAVILQLASNIQYSCNDVCEGRVCQLGTSSHSIPDVTSTTCAKTRVLHTTPTTTTTTTAAAAAVATAHRDAAAASSWSSWFPFSRKTASTRTAETTEEEEAAAGADRTNQYRRPQWRKIGAQHPAAVAAREASSSSWASSSSLSVVAHRDAHVVEEDKTLVPTTTSQFPATEQYCGGNNSLPATPDNTTTCAISWNGGFSAVVNNRLNRFVQLHFSMPRPVRINDTNSDESDWTTTLYFYVNFVLAVKNGTAVSDRGESGTDLLTRVPIYCRGGEFQCDGVSIPVVFGQVTNASTFTLVAYGVPTLAYIDAIRHGAVQAVFQNAGYTIATIVLRYTLFVGCVIQIIQLLYARYTIWNHLQLEKYKKERREAKLIKMQRDALAASMANPKDSMAAAAVALADMRAKAAGLPPILESSASAIAIDGGNGSATTASPSSEKEHLGAFEQNWALLLNIMCMLYMNPLFAVSVYVQPTPNFFDFLEYKIPLYFVITVVLCVLALSIATLETKPSYTMRASLVLLFLVLLVLDLVDAGERGWHFNTVECANFQCSGPRWAVIAVILGIIVIIGGILFYLHRNLATLPYLATRPRQLSMRLMIFIFTSYVAYYVISTSVGLVLFSKNDMLDQSHSELRIGTLVCAFTFVTIITTSFKFVLRTDRIPPHPSDVRWKKIVWSAQWYTWLSLHGGGAYIFMSESEEEDFEIVQETKQDNISDEDDDEFDFLDDGLNLDKLNKNAVEETGGSAAAAAADATADYEVYSEPGTTASGSNSHRAGLFGAGDNDDDDGEDVIANTWRRRRAASLRQQQQQQQHTGANNAATCDMVSVTDGSTTTGKRGRPQRSNSNKGHGRAQSGADSNNSPDRGAGPFSSPNMQQQQQQQRGYATHIRANSGGTGSDSDETSKSSLSARVFRRVESFTSIDDRTFSKVLRRPAHLVDAMEDTVIGAAKLFRLISTTRPPFMNLETAIDLFNLSYEAYGVAVSKGDMKITTGITVSQAYEKLKGGTKKLVCCCCCEMEDHHRPHEFKGLYAPTESLSDALENQSFDYGAPGDGLGNFSDGKTVKKFAGGGGGNNNNSKSNNINNSTLLTRGNSSNHSSPTSESGLSMPDLSAAAAAATVQKQRRASNSSLPTPRNSFGHEKPPINTEQYGYRNLFAHEAGGVQAVICEMMDAETCPRHTGKYPRYVVAFRGTDSKENFIDDLRFTREVFAEMQKELSFVNSILEAKVHNGFYQCWMKLERAVLDKMAELISDKPSNRVLVTGHSLGGAMAGLCAYTIATRFKSLFSPPTLADANRMVQVYTYGMPKLGDSVFRDEYNKKIPYTFRIVNESDTVSGVGVFMGHHVGIEVCIDRYGNFICNPMAIEKLFRPTQGRGLSLRHHSMYAYGSSMNRIASHTQFGNCPSRCLDPYVPTAATVAAPAAVATHSSGRSSSSSASSPSVPSSGRVVGVPVAAGGAFAAISSPPKTPITPVAPTASSSASSSDQAQHAFVTSSRPAPAVTNNDDDDVPVPITASPDSPPPPRSETRQNLAE